MNTRHATAPLARAVSGAAVSGTAARYVVRLTQDCPQPRTAGRSRICDRCGSMSHPETSCPTLWRIYAYNTPEEYEHRRAKRARHLERRAERKAERTQRREKNRAGWAAALVEPSDESGPSDESDSDASDDDAPPPEWDPSLKWCYNCAASGHHWGDDCFLRRTNPTRPTGDPSPFSEALASSGPFSKPRKDLPVRGTPVAVPPARRRRSDGAFLPRPSLLEDMERDDDSDWFARRQALRRPPVDYDSPARGRSYDSPRRPDTPRGRDPRRPPTPGRGKPPGRSASRPRSSSPPPRRVRRGKGHRRDQDAPSPFRPQYRGGYS